MSSFEIRGLVRGDLDFAAAALRSLPGLVERPSGRRMVFGLSHGLGDSPLCWAVGSPAKG